MAKNHVPRHVGFIPDGNRRWVVGHGLPKQDGYAQGIKPGLLLYEQCKESGIKEMSIIALPKTISSVLPFKKRRSGVPALHSPSKLHVVAQPCWLSADETSPQFPEALKEFRQRQGAGIKVNLLVNYGWEWDLAGLKNGGLRSDDVSRLDLIVRWGGRRRLSGFLPVQSVYADFYVRDEFWPDFNPRHFAHALAWYEKQDQTLGG